MGKSKKKKNKDFQKVKFKVGRTLQKAANETNASFRTRSIQVIQQLKTDTGEPSTKRKLNINELLTQCQHYSATVRHDAVTGLRELLTSHKELMTSHFSAVLQKSSELLTDKDPVVRQSVIKLLKMFLPNFSEKQIQPFFSLLSAHVCCAMTHIYDDIQKDSLLVLDLLLDTFPGLVTSKSNQILSNFIEQISRQQNEKGKSSRTLAANPNSRLSSLAWRGSVLNRLQRVMSAILKSGGDRELVERRIKEEEVGWCVDSGLCQQMFPMHFRDLWSGSGFILKQESSSTLQKDNNEEMDISSLVKTLVPLLMECWVELTPSQQNTSAGGNMVHKENLNQMYSVVSVIQMLWDCESETQEVDAMGKYLKDFQLHFMASFPFSIQAYTGKTGKKEKKAKHQVNVSAESLNLAICDIMTYFLPLANQDQDKLPWMHDIYQYLTDFLSGMYTSSVGQNGRTIVKILKQLLDCGKIDNDWLSTLLEALFKRYRGAHIQSVEKKIYLTFFAEIIMNTKYEQSLSNDLRKNFLMSLPELLPCVAKDNQQMAALVISIMKKAACQKCSALLQAIQAGVKTLYDSTRVMPHVDMRTQRELLSLLYYLPDLGATEMKVLVQLCQQVLPTENVSYIVEVLHQRYLVLLSYSESTDLVQVHLSFLLTVLLGIDSGGLEQDKTQSDTVHHCLGGYTFTDGINSQQWDRHCSIAKIVTETVVKFPNPDQVLDVVSTALEGILSEVHLLPIQTAYSIIFFAATSCHHGYTPNSQLKSLLVNLCTSLVHMSVEDRSSANETAVFVWRDVSRICQQLLLKLHDGISAFYNLILSSVDVISGPEKLVPIVKMSCTFLSDEHRPCVAKQCPDVIWLLFDKVKEMLPDDFIHPSWRDLKYFVTLV